MKFSILACGLFAALASAMPASEGPSTFDASSEVTGESAPVLVETLAERDLTKRANVIFEVFPNAHCQGGSTVITRDGSGAKGDFSPAQCSVRIDQLTNGWHLSMYTGLGQSGVITRLTAANVGANQCWVQSGGTCWLSYGLYSS